jgi:hypothetical protein
MELQTLEQVFMKKLIQGNLQIRSDRNQDLQNPKSKAIQEILDENKQVVRRVEVGLFEFHPQVTLFYII